MDERHRPVKASELKDGDIMRIGVSTGYVLITAATELPDGRIAVFIDKGEVANTEPNYRYDPEHVVHLSTYRKPELTQNACGVE